jgi:hypothetical protein
MEFSMNQPTLKPQDIVVAVKIAVSHGERFTYVAAARQIGLAPSRIHSSVQMLIKARLASGNSKDGVSVSSARLADVIIFGVPYFFPPVVGGPTRGMATGTALDAMHKELLPSAEAAYVWPDSEGKNRGSSLLPIHPCLLTASKNDPILYQVFMAIDVLRTESSRERDMAIKFIRAAFA